MSTIIFNEIGFSLIQKGSWAGISNEIEYPGGLEVRKYGWRGTRLKDLREIYIRIWIGKRVFILGSKSFFHMKKKDRMGFKCILGFSFRENPCITSK